MLLERSFNLRDAEIGGDGRTLILAIVPWDTPALVNDGEGEYEERFVRGSFKHVAQAPNRVELRYNHRQDNLPYGYGQELIEDPSHLIGAFRIAPSEQGDQILALVRDEQLRGVSLGFIPGHSQETTTDGKRSVARLRVKQLPEVSLVTSPAYKDGRVLSLRSESVNVAERERERLYWARARLL
jgi:HK97 family phage prohead protease